MPLLSSPHNPQMSRRAARVLVALVLLAPLACDRLAGTNAQNIAFAQRHFDSVNAADTMALQRTASQDSLFAIREVQRRTDSIIRLTQPDLAPSSGSPAATPTTGAEATSSISSAAGVTTAPNARPVAATTTPAPGAFGARPVNPNVKTDVQMRLARARSLGDSIANAKVGKLVGQNRAVASGDSARGLIQFNAKVPGTRPVLMVDGGRTSVALTGIGVDGLSALNGADVVVHGMRVSPRDIVVSSYNVRAVGGFPVLDGELERAEKGGWNISLSDKSGTRALASIPEALQTALGARIWIDASNAARPQTFGIITRR